MNFGFKGLIKHRVMETEKKNELIFIKYNNNQYICPNFRKKEWSGFENI
jgi:hypothetical protein